MYDFDLLEKKYKKYRFKKYFLISLAFIVLITVIVGSIIFFYETKTQPYPQSTKIEKKNQVEVKKQKIITKEIVKIKKAEKKKTHKPLTNHAQNEKCYYLQFFAARKSRAKYLHVEKKKLQRLGFDCYIYKGTNLLYLRCNRTRDYNDFLKSKELANKYKLDFIAKKVTCSQKRSPKSPPKKILQKPVKKVKKETFVLKSKKFDVNKLKKLFQERKSFNIALKLAQYYYLAHDYKQAIQWAKTANSIDKTDAESWIIYAKSLYTLGDKEKAKKILHIYSQFENSAQVKKLLSEWSDNR